MLPILRWIGTRHQAAGLLQDADAGCDVPLPASALPPDIRGARRHVGQVQRRAAQAADAVDHAALACSAAQLRRHVHEAADLLVHVAAQRVPPVLAPLAAEDAAFRRVGRHGWDGVADERQTGLPSAAVDLPGAEALAGRVGGVEDGGVDDADDGDAVEAEGDGDAEHGEEVRVVDGAVERVDAPAWLVGNEIVL